MLLRNDDDGQARRHRQFIHRNIRLRPDKLLFPVRQEGGGGGGGGGSKVLLSLSQTQKLFHPPSQVSNMERCLRTLNDNFSSRLCRF